MGSKNKTSRRPVPVLFREFMVAVTRELEWHAPAVTTRSDNLLQGCGGYGGLRQDGRFEFVHFTDAGEAWTIVLSAKEIEKIANGRLRTVSVEVLERDKSALIELTVSDHARPHPVVYQLSRNYGPPRINLRDAEILDAYGDDENCSGPAVRHIVPEDVTMEEMWFYGGFGFVGFEDLLFYLYPVALATARDQQFHGGSFLYALEGFCRRIRRLPPTEQEAIREGLRWMGLVAVPEGHVGRVAYPRLRRFVRTSLRPEES